MMTYVLDMKKQGVRAQTHFLSALKMSARQNILHCTKRASNKARISQWRLLGLKSSFRNVNSKTMSSEFKTNLV